MARSSKRLFLAAGLLLCLTGCAGPYYAGYRFDTHPAEVVAGGPEEADGARALFRVVGVRRADEERGRGPEVEVRVRLEARGGEALRLDTETLSLVSGDLTELGPPRVDPAGPVEVSPGGSAKWTLSFPLPEDRSPSELELDGMLLRVTLVEGARRTTASISFERAWRDDPWGWSGPYAFAHFSYYGCWP